MRHQDQVPGLGLPGNQHVVGSNRRPRRTQGGANFPGQARIFLVEINDLELQTVDRGVAKSLTRSVDSTVLKERAQDAAEQMVANLKNLLAHESRIVGGEQIVDAATQDRITVHSPLKLLRTQVSDRIDDSPSLPALGNDPTSKD